MNEACAVPGQFLRMRSSLNIIRSAKGADERYRMVWEWLVFPNSLTTFDRGQDGLEDFFSRELKATFEQFEQQWQAYTLEATRNYSGLGRYMKINPFVPHLTYPGLPTYFMFWSQNLHRARVEAAGRGLTEG